jgi:drug/metabolite transporter (DMT)-like permease
MKSADPDLVSFTQGAIISAAVVGIAGATFTSLRAFREDIPVFGIMMLMLSGLAVSVYSVIVIVERRVRSVRRPATPTGMLIFGLALCPLAVVLSKIMKIYPLDPFEIYIMGIVGYVFAARYVSKQRKGA